MLLLSYVKHYNQASNISQMSSTDEHNFSAQVIQINYFHIAIYMKSSRFSKCLKMKFIYSYLLLSQTLMSQSTVKTLNIGNIGTPRLTTVVVLNIKQFNFTMQ